MSRRGARNLAKRGNAGVSADAGNDERAVDWRTDNKIRVGIAHNAVADNHLCRRKGIIAYEQCVPAYCDVCTQSPRAAERHGIVPRVDYGGIRVGPHR